MTFTYYFIINEAPTDQIAKTVNATYLLSTLNVRKEIRGAGLRIISTDYMETQLVWLGYGYKF